MPRIDEEAVRLFRQEGVVHVGYSGGPDSTALLHALSRLRHWFEVRAIHVNHGTEHSDLFEKACVEFCRHIDVPLTVLKVEVPPEGSFEAAAREERYKALRSVSSTVAIAHTKDDFIENVFISFKRHRWFFGIRKFSQINGLKVVRPILHWSRDCVEAYLEKHNIRQFAIEDPSNRDSRYDRNWVRENLRNWYERFPGFRDSVYSLCSEIDMLRENVAVEDCENGIEDFAEGLVRVNSAYFAKKGEVRLKNALIYLQRVHGFNISKEDLEKAVKEISGGNDIIVNIIP